MDRDEFIAWATGKGWTILDDRDVSYVRARRDDTPGKERRIVWDQRDAALTGDPIWVIVHRATRNPDAPWRW